jgi:zinc transport system substrate-binding protein
MLYYNSFADPPPRVLAMGSWPQRAVVVTLAAAVLAASARADAPRVVASIAPLASLVEGVMAGQGAPHVLVPPGASLHDYALKPSDAAALDGAALVFWVGPMLEAFLEKPMSTLGAKAKVVAMASAPGVVVHRGREGGVWESQETHDDHGHEDHEIDGHIWLDPANALAMVGAVREALIAADPANAARYAANADGVSGRLRELNEELATLVAPVKAKPFITFHDAYQYFEKRYGLNAVGTITVSPERPPGARRIAEIRRKVADLGAACVFAEPQFEPRIVRTVVEGTAARTGTLDPEGASLVAGPELYFDLMCGLGRDLVACLSGG